MSMNGVSAPDFKNYSAEQIEKFAAIMEAQKAKNTQLAASLMSKLSPEDDEKFDDYMADWDKFYEFKKAAEEQLAQHQREIDSAHIRIDAHKAERREIINQHKPKVVAALPKTNGYSNGHSNGHTATNGKKEKKKGGACTLM